ncbi:MAG: ABC transporter permease [Phycisphaerales bacterium]
MSPGKVIHVAKREFVATALTKGFIFGALVVPALMAALIPLVAVLAASATPPAEKGTVLVLDRSGEVFDMLSERLSREAIRERRQATARRIAENAQDVFGGLGGNIAGTAEDAVDRVEVPELRVERLPDDADLEAEKQRMRDELRQPAPEDRTRRLIGIIEVDERAVVKGPPPEPADDAEDDADAEPTESFGGYSAFFRPKINDEAVNEIENAVEWSIREKRYELAGVDRDYIRELSSIGSAETKEITEEGERSDSSGLTTFIIPVVAMVLILIATLTGGQYLLTTTIEEKSSRVVEVLLSAVSPMELMTGKILGQMAVGMSLLLIYNSLLIFAAISFSYADLIDPMLLVYFFILFILAYAMFASMMAAIGSAVNDLREAQSLMTPVMLISMVPYFFFMPVIRSPNSTLSTVMSFIPPFSPFIVIMRVASNDPPPAWQVWLAIGVMVLAAWGLMWAAAKVFRVGLLMFGKPPNLATLIKWIRMA